MSTISIVTAAPAMRRVAPRSASQPQTRLRITQRGRRVVAGVIAVPLAVVIGFGAISGGSALASHSEGAPAGSFETVTVMPGDSLWSIARDVAPQVDPRDVIDEISRLNNLASGELMAGQSLSIPAEYSSAK